MSTKTQDSTLTLLDQLRERHERRFYWVLMDHGSAWTAAVYEHKVTRPAVTEAAGRTLPKAIVKALAQLESKLK